MSKAIAEGEYDAGRNVHRVVAAASPMCLQALYTQEMLADLVDPAGFAEKEAQRMARQFAAAIAKDLIPAVETEILKLYRLATADTSAHKEPEA